MRRCIVTFEVETNVSIAALKKATITVPYRGTRQWDLDRYRNDANSVKRIAKAWPDSPIVHYVESNRVNVIRASTKRRNASVRRK